MLNHAGSFVPQKPQQQSGVGKKMLVGFLVVVFLGASGAAGYFYNEYEKYKGTPNKVVSDEAEMILEKVRSHILLPEEKPNIVTLTDMEKYKDQTFFKNAQVGDKVLIFNASMKAVLYSVSQDKILEVTTISGNQGGQSDVSGSSTDNP